MTIRNTHRLIIISLALVITAVVLVSAGQKIICNFCKGEITSGQYIEVNGKYYHPEHFLCDRCGTPLAKAKFFTKDGKHYCERCNKKLFSPKCAYCGKLIEGSYIEYSNNVYHKNCYINHIALRCSYCEGLIKSKYFKDFWGNVYHKDHIGKVAQCEYCGRLISGKLTGGGRTYSDGRDICGLCLETAITDRNKARSLLNDVIRLLAKNGIEIETQDIALHLVDNDELKKIARDPVGQHTGYAKYEGKTVNGRVVSREFDIYILNGMPKEEYLATAAHELMHIWQYINAPPGNDLAMCEGSCNYASFLVLQNYPGRKSDYIIDRMIHEKDKIYGDGFRRVRRFVKDKGIHFWLEYLRENKNLLAGY